MHHARNFKLYFFWETTLRVLWGSWESDSTLDPTPLLLPCALGSVPSIHSYSGQKLFLTKQQ